jgi:hypothetical protein
MTKDFIVNAYVHLHSALRNNPSLRLDVKSPTHRNPRPHLFSHSSNMEYKHNRVLFALTLFTAFTIYIWFDTSQF